MLKWIGAALVMAVCGWFGFSYAAALKAEERSLRQLISILDYMECELQYRMTPLPELCMQAAKEGKSAVHMVFARLAGELESQVAPDVQSCMQAALARVSKLPCRTSALLKDLGQSLGRFDVPGQLKGLDGVRGQCRSELESLKENKEPRLRSYQTLGICVGAALVILFI